MRNLRRSDERIPLATPTALITAAAVVALAAVPAAAASASEGNTQRVSVSSRGAQGDAASLSPSADADGAHVAFHSQASNLVPSDTNGSLGDVFVRDGATGRLVLASVDTAGHQGTGESWAPAISANGRFVAFASEVPSLVRGDTNRSADVFVRDLVANQTTRISLGAAGRQANRPSYAPSISDDGRYVTFVSLATNLAAGGRGSQVYLHNRATGVTTRLSANSGGTAGNGDSDEPAISGNGRFVAFQSYASNLVPGDTNETSDIFLRDVTRGTTSRLSVSSTGGQAERFGASTSPAINGDGRVVAFYSQSARLVPGDTNREGDVFVRDRRAGTTTRVSVQSGGTAQGNGDSGAYYGPSISRDGRIIAFGSQATNLVAGDTNAAGDIFVRDRDARVTARASVNSTGSQGDAGSYSPSVSRDGRLVAYFSEADNLVPADSNNDRDVFGRILDPTS